jgi:type II secretory pathway pseudopilin PulG
MEHADFNHSENRMKPAPIRRPARLSEEGYILVMVIFLVALLTLSLAVALPRVAKEIQRDRELETMHRGKQYARAVRMYYKKFGAYPPNVDALVKPTNNIRFLRKKYADPTTGKEDWKPILFGQNKAPTAMGFFGQALAGTTIAGIGPSGGNGLTGGSSLAGGSSFNQQTSTTDTSAPSGSTAPTGSTTGLTGQTFGGAGIIGFSPTSPKQSILVYKKKNHYNEWEFVYDPISEQMMQGGNTGTIGQPASSTTTPIGSSSSATTTNNSSSTTTTP